MEKEMLREAQSRESVLESSQELECTEADCQSVQHLANREYRVPSTQAKVTLACAKALLFQYCSHLPSDRQVPTTNHLLVADQAI